MPIYRVQMPDGSVLRIDGPEGAKDEDLISAASAYTPEKPASALRGMGVGAKGMAMGLSSIPLMAGDAINGLINMGTGAVNKLAGSNIPQLPTASSSLSGLLSKAGLPDPVSPSEKVVYEANRGFGAGATFPTPALLSGMGAIPALQGLSGAISGGVTKTSEESGAGPVLSTALGTVAGMAVPTSPDLFAVTKRGVQAAAEPFLKDGRENVVGNAIARMATSPKTALRNMADATDDVSKLTTAQASRDPGLLSTERAVANLPASGGRMAKRYAEQNSARRALLDSLAGTADDLASAKTARSAEAATLYEPAFNAGPLKMTEDLVALSKRPAFEQAAKKAMEIAGNEGLDLGDPTTTMRGLHYLKMGVDDLLGDAKPGTNTFRSLTVMKKDLISALDDVSPKGQDGESLYRAAREAFSAKSKPINQMETLQDLRGRTLNSGLDVSGNRILSQAKWTSAVTDKLPDLQKTLNKDQINVLQRIAKDLDYGKMSETGGKVAGSNTFQNMSVANVLGATLGNDLAQSPTAQSIMRPLGFLYKLPERQVEELLIDAMLDKNLAMRLMSKATERNVGELAKGLSRNIKASTTGSVAAQFEK